MLGPEDGIVGPATREALMDFQRAERLHATGRLDRATIAALQFASATAAR